LNNEGLHNIKLNDQIKEEETRSTKLSSESVNRKGCLGDLDVDGKVILQWVIMV
jgi:hypothetical protein